MRMEEDKIRKVEKAILHHKALYYQGRPEISDEKYDQLEAWLKKHDPENPVLAFVGSPVPTDAKKVKHDSKMLSLDKTYDLKALKKWIGNEEVVGLYKMDGSSCSLIYKGGRLTIAKTRGDGKVGEDITAKAMFIPSIPKTISAQEVEIRGEIYCTQTGFTAICEAMEELKLDKPSSLRNIVAGLLGRKEHTHLVRHLSFKAFDIIEKGGYELESGKLKELMRLGFDTPETVFIKGSNDPYLETLLNNAKAWMDGECSYLIDGLVFVYNKVALHKELGETSHHPKYKMAFKFEGDSAVTKIQSISWQVSRNGKLTPVANVEPVELSGAMIGRVTLHNFGMVKTHNLKAGDEIEIIRSGEVIPKFMKVSKSYKGEPEIPSLCPSCNNPLRSDNIWLMCDASNCPDKILEEAVHLVDKLGIEDISDKRLREMLNKGIITTSSDIFNVTIEDLLKLDKVKEKMATKMYNNIQARKNPTLPKFIAALGLDGLATSGTEKFIEAGFDTVEKIFHMSEKDICSIEGFAEKSAKQIKASIREKFWLAKNLISYGVNPIVEKKEVAGTGLAGKTFCITGALSKPRPQIEKDIKANAGSIASVTKNLSYLVTNETDGSSSKFVKAKSLGIQIITEEQLYNMMG